MILKTRFKAMLQATFEASFRHCCKADWEKKKNDWRTKLKAP